MVSQLAPVRRTTPSSECTDRLSEATRFGELLPGARLPVAEELGVQFGVRLTSIHEFFAESPSDGYGHHSPFRRRPLTDRESRYHYRSEVFFAAYLADGVTK